MTTTIDLHRAPWNAASLRAAADLVEQHPDLITPYVTSCTSGDAKVAWYLTMEHLSLFPDEQRAEALRVFDAIGGLWHMPDRDDPDTLVWEQQRGVLQLVVKTASAAIAEVTC